MRRFLAAVAALGLAVSAAATLATPVSAGAPTTKAASVTLKPIPAQSQVGKKVTLAGRVTGNVPKVKIQRKYAGTGWQTVTQLKPNKQGRFSVKVALTRGGPTTFRAVKGGLRSVARSLNVYQWLDLSGQSVLTGGQLVLINQTSRIGGRGFARSFEFPGLSGPGGGGGGVVVKTGGLCTQFETHTGFLDDERASLTDGDLQRLTVNLLDAAGDPVVAPLEYATPEGPAVRRAGSLAGSTIVIFGIGVDLDPATPGPITAPLGSPRLYCNAPAVPDIGLADLPFV